MKSIPYGYCQCGCGRETEIATCTRWERDWRKGELKPFVDGHRRIASQRKRWARERILWFLIENRGYHSPCWVWQGGLDSKGYGRTFVNSRRRLTHVLAYRALCGPVPTGCELDHLCRVKLCMNPSHLEPVSHAENMRRSPLAKLNWAKVAEIHRSDEHSAVLARRYGVSVPCIINLRAGRTWKRS